MATRCNLTSLTGLTRPCSSVGGIKTEVYITLKENIDTIDFVEEQEPYNTISNITLKEGAKWYLYEFNKNSSSFTSTANYDGQTAEFSYWQNDLALSFRKMDASMRLGIQALLQNEVVVVFTDANGVSSFMGYEEYVSSTSASFTTGTAKTDSNAMSITLSDSTSVLPYHLSDTALQSVKANVQE
jgi:hypothetical protein